MADCKKSREEMNNTIKLTIEYTEGWQDRFCESLVKMSEKGKNNGFCERVCYRVDKRRKDRKSDNTIKHPHEE